MILDTSFLIDVMREDDAAMALAETIERSREPQRLAAVTVFELHTGIARSDRPDAERDAVRAVVDSKAVVSADGALMRKAGRLHGGLVAEGNRIGMADAMIGATALSLETPLVTGNAAEFERISGLDVVAY